METDKNTALVCAWPQLIDMLKKLFAMDDKCSSFFLSYDYFPEDYEVSDKSSMSEKEFSKTLLYLINMFTKEGGFDSLIKIINFQ